MVSMMKKESSFFHRHKLCFGILLGIVVGLAVYFCFDYGYSAYGSCPTRENWKGEEVPVPLLAVDQDRRAGGKMTMHCHINDLSVHQAKLYLFQNGACQNPEGKKCWLPLMAFQRRSLFYCFVPEEEVDYRLSIEAEGEKGVIYRWWIDCSLPGEESDKRSLTPDVDVFNGTGEYRYTVVCEDTGSLNIVEKKVDRLRSLPG